MKKRKLNVIKKICYAFTAIFGLLFSTLSVFADTRGFAFRAFRIDGEIRWTVYNEGLGRVINSGKFITPSDGVVAFCIEPGVEALLIEDGEYDIYNNPLNFGSITGLSNETLDKLELISFYGYGLNGDTSDVAYLATQLEIWNTVRPNSVSYISGDFSEVDIKRAEIRNYVNNAYIKPSFNMTTVDIALGQETVIEDTNNVLNLFKVSSCTNCTATIVGNTLKVKSTNMGTAVVRLEKSVSNNEDSSILYTKEPYQKLMTFKHPSVFYATLNLNTYGGKIELNKKDSKTNTNTPQGEATLEGAVYGIYKSDGTKIAELTTNKNGYAISDNLPNIGNFYVQEIKASSGYNLDLTKYPVTLTADSLNVSVDVKEKVIDGNIKIIKYDSENNSCTAQGGASLKGAIYEVFDKNGTVVDTLTIGNDCTATSKNLPYGKYTVKEKQAPTGYLKDTNTYNANINSQGIVIEVTSKEQVQKGKISIMKQDSETKSCTPQGEATLKGAVYNIIDSSNNVVDTLTIGNDCTATSKDLPYGKYTVKEKTASKGYEIDTNVYNANINSNTITVNITSKEQVQKGKIRIIKQDSETKSCTAQGQATLIGAIYNIIDINNKVVDTVTIGNDCIGTSKNLPYGKYTIKEKTASKGYEIDTNTYNANINSQGIVVEVTSKEQVQKGKIRIMKQDSETKSCTAQGQATLIGAIYNIIDADNNIVDTLTIGNDCTATSKNLPYGKYTVKEKQAPTGYLKDTNTYEANINSQGIVVEVTSKEQVQKGKIRIMKQDSETKSCTAQGQATLIGAIYNIIDINNKVVDTVTIGNDCIGVSKDLPYGKYTVKEKQASTGYLKDTNTYETNINSQGIVVEVTSKEQVQKGKIRIIKQDSETKSCTAQGQATLIGAIYNIIDADNNIVDTLTIGNDCTATSKDLPYGKYTVKEKQASTGYLKDTNTYEANINSQGIMVEVTSKEQVQKGKISIMKQDSETKSCTAQGQATLKGAIYNIIDINNKVVDTVTIGNDCIGTSKDLPYGKYTVKEKTASKGYEIDTNVYNANINSNAIIINITSKEDVIKNFISILKQYDFVDGTTQFLNAEANITFEIYYSDGSKYGEIKTDKNGYATLEIPYGVWKFHQVNSPAGFEKIYDFFITVDENSEKEQYYNILNNKLSAYLKVIKVDSETNKTIELANTSFKIYNLDTKQYVSQYVGGKVYDTFKTDETGTLTTYLKLEAGNYKLVEINSPKGYLKNNDGLEFTIGESTHYNYTTYGAFITVSFKNTPIKGQIEINKMGESFVVEDGSFKYEKVKLGNVVFEIYADEDIKTSDGNHIYFNKGDLVNTLTTNQEGYAISDKLPLGKYYIVEVKTQKGYVLDNKKYYFELKEVDNKTPIVYQTYNKLNNFEKGTLEFTKTDLVSGDVIPNTLINIYTENDKLIFSGKTNSQGKIVIKDLKVGKYYIVEKEPATGYILNEEKVFFEIKENKEIVKATMTNKPIVGKLEFSKIDLSTDEPLPNTLIEIYTEDDKLVFSERTNEEGKIVIENIKFGKYYIMEKEAPEGYTLNTEKMYFEILEDGKIIKSTMKDKLITGTLEFTKTDLVSGDVIPNTLIEIYTENDELIFSGETDEDGKIVIEDLKYGKYYIVEKEPATGYILNEEKVFFEIKIDGEIVKASMTNEKIVDVPNTYVRESYKKYIISTMLILMGVSIYLYGKQKNK